MFKWLKRDNSKDRIKKIEVVVLGIDSTLRGISDFWRTGNKEQGDELLDAFFKTAIDSLLDTPEGRPDDLVDRQTSALLKLVKFARAHSLTSYIDEISSKLPASMSKFDLKQMSALMYELSLERNSRQIHKKAQESSRGSPAQKTIADKKHAQLLWRVCQNCGSLSLLATAPCFICGFSAKNERDMRRALFLSSNILEPRSLMAIASRLISGADEQPRVTIDGFIENIDIKVSEATEAFVKTTGPGNISELLKISLDNQKEFQGPPRADVICSKCNNRQQINIFSRNQVCNRCGSTIPLPSLRFLKASLIHVHFWLVGYAVARNDANYSDFIGAYTAIMEYTIRRDTPPTVAQARELKDRLSLVSPIEIREGISLIFNGERFSFARAPLKGRNEDRSAEYQGLNQMVNAMNILISEIELNRLRT